MQVNFPTELIEEVQSIFRKEARISSFHQADPSISDLPTVCESISQFGPSAPQYRCQHCNGWLLRDVKSLICVYCGGEQKRDTPPEPLRYKDTLAFKWLLGALELDGSEIVGPPIDADEVKNGSPAFKENLSISDLLDFEIKWPSGSDKLQNKTQTCLSHFKNDSSEISFEGPGGSLSQPRVEEMLPNASGLSEIPSSESVTSLKFQNTTIRSPFLSDEPDSTTGTSGAIGTDEPVWEANFQSADPLSDFTSITDNKFGDGKAHGESKNDMNLPTTVHIAAKKFEVSTHNGLETVENIDSHKTESDIFLQEHQFQSSVPNASDINGGSEHRDSFYNWNDFSGSSSHIENYHDSCIEENAGFVASNRQSISDDLFNSDVDVVQAENNDVGKLNLFSGFSNSQNDLNTMDNTHSKNLFLTSDSDEKGCDFISTTKSGGDDPKSGKNAETLISEMHDLCFMLEKDLCIPSNPTKLP